MGYVHTKIMKEAAQVITEKYYKHLSNNFYTNKEACKEIAIIPS